VVDVTEFDLAQIDELLTTTKAVSKRLDLTRDVPISLVLECIEIASHAPIGGNRQATRWLVVSEPAVKNSIAEIYASVGRPYIESGQRHVEQGSRHERVLESGTYLIDHLAEVPVMVLPVRLGRVDDDRLGLDAQSFFGSVIPAVWSFQLAARARGLGTRYTTFTARKEPEMAELLGIPEDYTQVALLPVAFYTGTGFAKAPRLPVEQITYLDRWEQPIGRPG
jgi:nitroreductase